MGWLFTQGQTRKQLITRLTSNWENENGTSFTCLRHTCTGNNLWTVWEVTKEGKSYRFIGLDMMKPQAGYGWGYKDLDERAGPTYVNCPEAYLDMVDDPGGYATEWRVRVREYWATMRSQRAKVAGLKPGMVISLVGTIIPHVTIYSVTGQRVTGSYMGTTYRIPLAMLGEPLATLG